MSKSYRRGSGKAVLASLTGLVLASSMWAPASAVEAPDGAPTAEGLALQAAPPGLKVSDNLANASGVVAAYIQFAGKGAFEQTQPLDVRRGIKAPVAKPDQVATIRAEIEAKAAEVTAASSGTALYTTTNTIPGVAISGDAAAIRELAQRSDVVKVSRLVPKVPTNKGGVVDTRALNTWAGDLGQTGNGVTIAIIDTGIDYTHAGFGGPGDVETFETASSPAAQESAPDPAWYDESKYVGGWDSVGDAYDATDPATSTPVEDPNPIDCQSHGSHVAGTAAGYGVTADGETFTGDYASLTAETVNEMRIGPGTAPEAQLVSLRVFGCGGSSLVVGNALDRVLDPNNDGNFGDRAHVVNMSLGSNFPLPDDPEVDIVNNLTSQGVLSVVSSGNDGDIYDIGGTPGSAKSALTVANSIGSQITLDRVDVLAPADVAGSAQGQYSVNFDSYATATAEELRGRVVMADASNRFGCNAFPEGSFDGEWVWLQWEEDGAFPCGSGVRFNNVEAAGGAGVVLDSPRDVFDAGIGGNATIPGVQFNRESSERLRPAAEAGTLEIQLAPEYIASATGPSNALDTLNASSSRGVHGSNGVVKPDVAAPGTLIGSVAVGTGDGASVKTGTSMAAPNVAGIAALVYAETDLNAYEVKNVIMNTATNDVTVESGGDVEYAPNRTGSGRVDALNAVNASAMAYDSEDQALVSVNFGVIELGADALTATRQISVRNLSDDTQIFTAEYLPASTMPGVDISLGAESVEVPGNAVVDLAVTMTINDPAALAKTIDPAAEVTQLGLARQFLADVSGRVELTSETNTLRVPVYAAPKPTSEMSANPKLTYLNGADTEAMLTLTGRSLAQGGAFGEPTSYTSLVSPFVLGLESPRRDDLPLESLYAIDLKSVGAASTVPAVIAGGGTAEEGLLNIGIATWENWNTLAGSLGVDIELDVDNDDTVDFIFQSVRADGLDLIVFQMVTVADDGTETATDNIYLANGVDGSVDTNTFDTSVVTLPLPVADLGLELGTDDPIQYGVSTNSGFNINAEGDIAGPVDETGWIPFNLTDPSLWFEGAGLDHFVFADQDGATLNVHRELGVMRAEVLLLHHHNASGVKDEVVPTEVGKLRFPDTKRDLFEEEINQIADLGITTGFDDGTYRPLDDVRRDAMAAFLYRLAGEPAFAEPAVSPFTDITPDTQFYKEMAWMEATGLSTGYEEDDNTFTYRPLAPVNRDAMAAFMNRFSGLYCNIADAEEYVAPQEEPFDDVPLNDLFHREISWMKTTGITTGFPDGEYKSLTPVARNAMAAFMIRLLDYNEENGGCNP